MLFSRSTEYGIRAMTYLAALPEGRLAGAREISQAEQIPMPFLWKILQSLAKRNLIRSYKGLRGGYRLAQPPGKLTLRMILDATDGADRLGNCLLGLPHCSDQNPCPLHETWKEVRENLTAMLHEKTLADLARVAQQRSSLQIM